MNVPLPVLRNRRFWPTRDQDVGEAVIVVVADGDAHAIHVWDVESSSVRDIAESAVAIVAVEL